MSPNVGNFVHDLVEMAKAMETLPQVQAELDRANTQIESYAKQVQDREISILNFKADIAELLNKVRSLEVERDDASFRVMEAEDKTASVLRLVRSAQASLADSVIFLDPPKLQPEPVKEQEATQLPSAQETFHSEAQVPSDWAQDKAETSVLPQGSSESSPISGSTVTDHTNSIADANTASANISEPVGSSNSVDVTPTHGPYFGKRYIDVSGFVSLDDWRDGGGTYDDYYGGRVVVAN